MNGALALCATLVLQTQTSPPSAAAVVASEDRFALQRRDAEALAAAIAASGLEPSFTAALKTVVDAHPGEVDSLPFVPVRSGLSPIGAFRAFTSWHSSEAEGRPPVAVDHAIENHPFDAIVDFDRQLAARGVELLLVILPTRLEIHPELMVDVSTTGFVGLGSATQQFVVELSDHGVDALSLTRLFVEQRFGELESDQLFLRNDPHLTPRGYELVARATALRLAAIPGFARGSLAEGRDYDVVARDFDYQPGDTLVQKGAVVEPVRGPTLQKNGAIVDFTDAAAPLVVLGDSHVRLYCVAACDFVSQLARFTAQEVDCLKADGGAADQVRLKLGRRDAERWKTMKTVVWVVSETLLVPALRWKKIPMAEE